EEEVVEGQTDSPKEKKKKKKRRREEEVVEEEGQTDSPKEKKRGQEEGGEDRKCLSAVEETGKHKKKRKKTEEGETDSQTPVAIETSQTGKRRKKKNRPAKESVAEVEADPLRGEEEEEEESSSLSQGSQHSRVEQEDGFLTEKEALLELQQFVPNLLSRAPDEIKSLLRYDLKRFREFRRQGIALRNGRCSSSENQQIRNNVANFLALTGISSANQLLYPQRYKDKEAEIKKLRVQHRFLERMADGIPRSCRQVYVRAKKMFDGLNYMGRFSEEELQSLKKLHTLHGNDWKTIAMKMDRSVYALQKRFAHIASVHGTWDSEEFERLIEAVKAHMERLAEQDGGGSGTARPWVTRDQLCNNLPWKEVSKKVQTRCWTQCRIKWFSFLKARLDQRPAFSGGSKTLQAKIDLINTLYSLNVEDHADIDWVHVADSIGNVTPFYVQKSYHRLKVSRVPHWLNLSFCEIIEFLHHEVVPQLKEKLEVSGRRNPEEEQRQKENQGRYLLSHIFPQDHDYREIDNAHVPIYQSDEELMEGEQI
ncbi:transcription termination factor 1-like, partial [Polymixia lowei]